MSEREVSEIRELVEGRLEANRAKECRAIDLDDGQRLSFVRRRRTTAI
jgi:hypothetical protein